MKKSRALIWMLLFFCNVAVANTVVKLQFEFKDLIKNSDSVLIGDVLENEEKSVRGVYKVYNVEVSRVFKGKDSEVLKLDFAILDAWENMAVSSGVQVLFLSSRSLPSEFPPTVKYMPTAYFSYPYRINEDADYFTVQSCDSHPPIIRADSAVYKAGEALDVGNGCVDREGYTDRLLDLIEKTVAEQKEADASTEPCGQ